jgi:hypothetical protein
MKCGGQYRNWSFHMSPPGLKLYRVTPHFKSIYAHNHVQDKHGSGVGLREGHWGTLILAVRYIQTPASQLLGQTCYSACDSPPLADPHSLRPVRPLWWRYRRRQVELASGCPGRQAAPPVRDASAPVPKAPLTTALYSGTEKMTPRSCGVEHTQALLWKVDSSWAAQGTSSFYINLSLLPCAQKQRIRPDLEPGESSLQSILISPFNLHLCFPICFFGKLDVVVEWLVHLLRIREVAVSNQGSETGHSDCGFSCFT